MLDFSGGGPATLASVIDLLDELPCGVQKSGRVDGGSTRFLWIYRHGYDQMLDVVFVATFCHGCVVANYEGTCWLMNEELKYVCGSVWASAATRRFVPSLEAVLYLNMRNGRGRAYCDNCFKLVIHDFHTEGT